jgi:SnoaL-like domain
MIEQTIERWHQHLRGEVPGGLDELLHDDVVFYSPVVFTAQRGKDVTKLYLEAAGSTFGGDGDGPGSPASKFHYVRETLNGNTAVLEFETEMGGKYVNGVDIITCDDDGKIVEFKVMIRPLQAINAVHDAMRAMLEQMR